MMELFRRLQYLFNRRRFEQELDEEIRDHLERKAADGVQPDQARRQFGNVTLLKEDSRSAWTWVWLEQLSQDIRYALRTMKVNRLFTLTAVVSLALGIGANGAIYSFMDAILMRSLPVERPEDLVVLTWRARGNAPVVHTHWGESYDAPGGGVVSPNFPYPALRVLWENNQSFSALFGYVEAGHLNMVVDNQATIVNSECVTGGYFGGLGVPAAAGRLIGPDDDRAGAPIVAMLTFDYWRSRFGGDPAVIGKAATVNNIPVTIVGVAAPEFYGVQPQMKADLFIPMAHQPTVRLQPDGREMFENGNYYWIQLMGRLKPGVTLVAAQAQLGGPLHAYIASTATKDRERAALPELWLTPGGSGMDSLRRQYSKPLWILMGMVGLILLIACANVANLQSARAAARRREIAVRLGLGAGRFRVIRQLLTESVLLALAGGIAGIGVAAAGIRLLLTLLVTAEDGFSVNVAIDWRLLGFTFLIAVAAGVGFGLAPALQTSGIDITPALKQTRSSDPRSSGVRWGFLRFGLSHVLVAGQIALSLLLVVSAGLFVRTVSNLHSVNLGFNAENVLLFNIDASRAGYKGAALTSFYSLVESRLRSAPGAIAATSSDMPLVGGWTSRTIITVPGIPQPPEGQRGPNTSFTRVGASFFETMQVPIVAGRGFDERDAGGGSNTAVVNQVFAETYFPGRSAVGQHFSMGSGPNKLDLEIVGVSKSARYSSLKQQIPPVTYLPWRQVAPPRRIGELYFEVRTHGDPLALANTVRQIVRKASPLVPVQGVTTQKARIDDTIRQERMFATLSACFGGLALVMASVGLYGAMAYNTARRTNEIGIRMALGANRGRIVRMVLSEVAALCVAGAAIGFAGVYQGTRLLKSMLFGMQPTDPGALAVSVGVLVACAFIAGFLPARRASRIDPMTALRSE